MGIPSITHQLVAADWSEDLTNAVTITPGLFWREIRSEPDERGRFLVSWKDGDPISAFVIGRNGDLLQAPEIMDTAIGIVRLWEAENLCRSHAPAATDGEGAGE